MKANLVIQSIIKTVIKDLRSLISFVCITYTMCILKQQGKTTKGTFSYYE